MAQLTDWIFDRINFFQPIDSWNILQNVCFLTILVIFRLDLGQITFDPVENAFATQQLAFLVLFGRESDLCL